MNEKYNRTADNGGRKTNEDIYVYLYQLNRRMDELTVLVASLKRLLEGSENE